MNSGSILARTRFVFLAALLSGCYSSKVYTVKVDTKGYNVDESVPFDQPILFVGSIADTLKPDSVLTFTRSTKTPDITTFDYSNVSLAITASKDGWTRKQNATLHTDGYTFLDTLEDNRYYQFAFTSVAWKPSDKVLSHIVLGGDLIYNRHFKGVPLNSANKRAFSDSIRVSLTRDDSFRFRKTADSTFAGDLMVSFRTRQSTISRIGYWFYTNTTTGVSGTSMLSDSLQHFGQELVTHELAKVCDDKSLPSAVRKLGGVGRHVATRIAVGESALATTEGTVLLAKARIRATNDPDSLTTRIENIESSEVELRLLAQYLRIDRLCYNATILNGRLRAVSQAEALADTMMKVAIDLREHQRVLADLRQRSKQAARVFERRQLSASNVTTATTADLSTAAGWHVRPDIGFILADQLGGPMLHFGINITPWAVNRNKGYEFRDWDNFSFTAGVTANSVKDEGVRNDLFASRAALLGFGFRILGPLRIGTGVVVFKSVDPNPTITSQRLAFNIYGSVSYDWDLVDTLGKLGKIF